MLVRSLDLLAATIFLERFVMIFPITQYFWYLLCQNDSLNGLHFDDLNGLLISSSHSSISPKHGRLVYFGGPGR